jgi:hypothetical protein
LEKPQDQQAFIGKAMDEYGKDDTLSAVNNE